MARIGRNDPCHCGSGKKYKKCCESKARHSTAQSRMLLVVVGGAMLAAIAVGIASFSGSSAASGQRVWDPVHGHFHGPNGAEVP